MCPVLHLLASHILSHHADSLKELGIAQAPLARMDDAEFFMPTFKCAPHTHSQRETLLSQRNQLY